MKKYLYYFLFLPFFIGCNGSIENLDAVVQDKRIQQLLDEYIVNVLRMDENKNVFVAGNIGKKSKTVEIALYNQQPILYINQDADYLNLYLKSKEFGFFRYKGINFYVTNDLQNIFKLEYKSFDHFQNKFEKKNEPEPNDPYSMFININIRDSSITYYSNSSKESLKWKKIK